MGCLMHIPENERNALAEVMRQAENDLKSAHAVICQLQHVDPGKSNWPEWSPQANTIRWFAAIRDHFKLNE